MVASDMLRADDGRDQEEAGKEPALSPQSLTTLTGQRKSLPVSRSHHCQAGLVCDDYRGLTQDSTLSASTIRNGCAGSSVAPQHELPQAVTDMYQSSFDLKQLPFPATPDPGALVVLGPLGDQLGELVGCLTSGQGIGVMTGPAGSGKTLACLVMLRDLTQNLHGICLRTGLFQQPGDMLKAVLHGLGRSYRERDDQDLRLAVCDAVGTLAVDCDGLLLIVDEAHRLSLSVLEELRGLTNIDSGGQPLVRLLLSGQLELEETLTDRRLEGLSQRIRAQVRLQGLTRAESKEYLRARIRFAGGEIATIFSDDALDLIASVCDGSPRCLNHLADHSLRRAACSATRPVTRRDVLASLEELRQLPLQFAETVVPQPLADDTIVASPDVTPQEENAATEMTQTEDGFSVVEVGAPLDPPASESRELEAVEDVFSGTATINVPPSGEGVLWDRPEQDAVATETGTPKPPTEDAGPPGSTTRLDVDVTEFDVVLPESGSVNEHQQPRPHAGFFGSSEAKESQPADTDGSTPVG